MKIEKFEDIQAWQEARILVEMIYGAIKLNKSFYNDYKFREQITDAAVSIMSNIAEGFSRRSNKEFIQFLFISKSSAAEVQSHLYVALDQEYMTKPQFNMMYDQADKICRYVSNFITYLLNKKI
jgi:four helix bundle protein